MRLELVRGLAKFVEEVAPKDGFRVLYLQANQLPVREIESEVNRDVQVLWHDDIPDNGFWPELKKDAALFCERDVHAQMIADLCRERNLSRPSHRLEQRVSALAFRFVAGAGLCPAGGQSSVGFSKL